jgi:NDP-sugar pyrophosphorylase family protein
MNSGSGWKAGIIAAGAGERLRAGHGTLKPLVTIGGETLVDRVLASIGEVAPARVVVIVNERSTAVRDHVSRRLWPFALDWIVETTASSMHSFLRVVESLAAGGDGGPFLVSTVDTVAAPGEYVRFARACAQLDADITLAVTAGWDDEKPLLVEVDGTGRVVAVGAAIREHEDWRAAPGQVFATAGYYAVRSSILQEADVARADGLGALRSFLARLVERGYSVCAVPVAPAIDVDRPADVAAAEAFLNQVRL